MRSRLLFLAIGALVLIAGLWQLVRGRSGASQELERAPEEIHGEPVAPRAIQGATPSAESPGREELDIGSGGPRSLVLVLVRFPDDAPLADVEVETEPAALVAEDRPLFSDADGRIALELPAGTAEIELRASGFENASVALERGAGEPHEQRVALVPSSGLFGRVVQSDGAPAAGAALALSTNERLVYYARHVTRSRPETHVSARERTVARAITNERGFYYLPCATRTSRTTVEVRAATEDGLSAMTEIELPREPAALDDLVLAETERLHVRVLDIAGRPIEGAVVVAGRRPCPGATDAAGELVVAEPSLPSSFFARADGFLQLERRHDGVVVDDAMQVESCATRVELVVVPAPGADLHIVDAETRSSIYLGHGLVELVRHGTVAVSTSFEPDKRGIARLSFFESTRELDLGLPELARIHFEREGYVDGLLEIDPRAAVDAGMVEMELQPDPGFLYLRGRVVRAGEPVAGLQLGLQAQPRADGPLARTWQYSRGYSDDAGRFALRWRAEPGLAVTVFPHWTEYQEFAFIGPIDAERAAEGEHVLELLPAVRVPAILRGAAAEGTYLYYVRVPDEGDSVAPWTTINGAPLEFVGSGEVRTQLLLPSHRRVRVTIGFRTEQRIITEGSTPVEHDPAHPVLPLVFDVPRLFTRIAGRVAGFSADEMEGLDVAFTSSGDETGRLAPVAGDGSFALERVPFGRGELFLVTEAEREGSVEVLARLELELDGAREDLVLARDPGSLPEEEPQR